MTFVGFNTCAGEGHAGLDGWFEPIDPSALHSADLWRAMRERRLGPDEPPRDADAGAAVPGESDADEAAGEPAHESDAGVAGEDAAELDGKAGEGAQESARVNGSCALGRDAAGGAGWLALALSLSLRRRRPRSAPARRAPHTRG
jgi:hypothetical protein